MMRSNNTTKHTFFLLEVTSFPHLLPCNFYLQFIYIHFITSKWLNFDQLSPLQGVPKVRSSDLIHSNFWSKLYFYMKFLEHVISLPSTCIQNFRNWHARFDFLSHSVAVAAWSGIQCVDPQMIHFQHFYHLLHRSQSTPKHYLFILGILKKYILGIYPEKIMIPASFHSKAFVYFFTNLRPAGRYLAD